MKRSLVLLVTGLVCFATFLFLPSLISAKDNLNYTWSVVVGGSDIDMGSVFVDPSGYVYFAGEFSNTVDFDPTATVENHVSNGDYDLFISKYDSNGNYYWTKTWGYGNNEDDVLYDVKWDKDQNMYVLGEFGGTIDFNPDATATDSHSAVGSVDGFLTRYNSDGTYAWTKVWGGSALDRPSMLKFDAQGNFYMIGAFSGTADFNPDTLVADNHTSNGIYDAYLTKLNPDASYAWTKTWGSTSYDKAVGLAIDSQDNLYISGDYSLTVDFDPGSGTDNHTMVTGQVYDCFLVKYDQNDNYVWGKSLGTSGMDMANAVVVDDRDNIYISGFFGGQVASPLTVDLNPDSGVDNHLLNGNGDAFISKFDSSGNYVWGKTWGGSAGEEFALRPIVDNGYLYVPGYFNSTTDFDPSGGTNTISNIASSADGFLSKFDLDGEYYWTKTWGGSGFDWLQSAVIRGSNLYLAGYSGSSIDLDPNSGTAMSSYGGSLDTFLIKFDYDITPPALTLGAPSGNISDPRPTLSFNLGTDTSGIDHYAVTLDPGKAHTYHLDNLPASYSGYWKNDNDYEIEYVGNEIHVFFKGLITTGLTEGAHDWRVTATDKEGNQKELTSSFILDFTKPQFNQVTLANNAWNIKNESTHTLLPTQSHLSLMGKASDSLSGIGALEWNLYKVSPNGKESLYFTQNYPSPQNDFFVTAPSPIKDGFYRARLILKDKAGNISDPFTFYLSVNQPTPKNNKGNSTVKPLINGTSSALSNTPSPTPLSSASISSPPPSKGGVLSLVRLWFSKIKEFLSKGK